MRNLVIAFTAALMLTSCAGVMELLGRGSEFTREQLVKYCASTTPEQRLLLREQLLYSDGSPMIIVYCEPHGEEE